MASKAAIEDRRRQVRELMMRGVPGTDIAKILNVHRNTIVNDLKIIREENRKEATEIDVYGEIGLSMKKYDEIFTTAMTEYLKAEKDRSKASFLTKALDALDKKMRFLVEVGILPKAAQEVSATLTVEGVDVRKAGVDELEILHNKLSGRLERLRGVSDNN